MDSLVLVKPVHLIIQFQVNFMKSYQIVIWRIYFFFDLSIFKKQQHRIEIILDLLTDELLHPVCPDRRGDQVQTELGLHKDADTWKCTCCQYCIKDNQLKSKLVTFRKKLMTVIQVTFMNFIILSLWTK